MGRPLVEGEPRSVEMKVRITPTMASRIDRKRKKKTRSDWLRETIERELES